MVESTTPTPLDLAADDFITHRPEYGGHLSTVLLHIEAIGLPYCYDCHDWHAAADGHSAPPIPRPREEGTAALGTVLALACWVGAMLLFAWCLVAWAAPAPPASATRVVPGVTLPDLCHNLRGTQTILDLTTGHRYRVAKVTPAGNVCRPLPRRAGR